MLKQFLYITVGGFFLLAVASNSFAASKKSPDKPEVDCNAATTTAETNWCAGEAYGKADKKLNEVYKQLVATLDEAQKKLLKETQVLWIKFRDAHCEFESYEVRGGTSHSGLLSACLEHMTIQRTKELSAIFETKESH